MSPSEIADKLNQAGIDLTRSFDLTFHHVAPGTGDPLDPATPATGEVWDKTKSTCMRKREKNWFVADLTMPEERDGLALAGGTARIQVNGYAPFTLYLDGVEFAREEHAWLATGPIS